MATIPPFSDGAPVTVTPSGLGTSGVEVAITVAAPSGFSATRGAALKLQVSSDGLTYGDGGTVQDGPSTLEVIPHNSDGSSITKTVAVWLPGARSVLLTPHNCSNGALTVTLATNAY